MITGHVINSSSCRNYMLIDVSCCPGEELNEKLQWLPCPAPDDENPSHYVLGNEPTKKNKDVLQLSCVDKIFGTLFNVPLAAVSEECTQREISYITNRRNCLESFLNMIKYVDHMPSQMIHL